MIFYFSGTGNSKWVAERIASEIGDRAIDISSIDILPDLSAEKYIGLVFPVYAWGAAQPMAKFAASLPKTATFTFGICTCGADAGLTMKKLTNIYHLESCYSVVMPSNYIIGEDIESDEVIRLKLEMAKSEISVIASEILNNNCVYRVTEGALAGLKTNLVSPAFNRFARDTKPFYADDRCTGCGLCERMCPARTIRLVNNSPTWGKECYQCLKCINCCPESAIQYGKKTKGRGRYYIGKYI